MKMGKLKYIIVLFTLFLYINASAQTRRALLVGISNYNIDKTGWNPIHGANDVMLMSMVLRGFNICSIKNENATFKGITSGLEKLISESKKGDIIFILLSGHGQPFKDIDGDEDDGWDESFIPYDAQKTYKKGIYEGQNHLTDDILHSYLLRLRSKIGRKGVVYVVIDACHSGGSSRDGLSNIESGDEDVFERGSALGFSTDGSRYDVKRNDAKTFGYIESNPTLSKIIMLESCLSTQKSKELRRIVTDKSGNKYTIYCGPLSYSVYKVLSQNKSKISYHDSWITNVQTVFDSVKSSNNQQQMVIERSE